MIFGKRVYKTEKAQFSEASRIYLGEIKRKLAHDLGFFDPDSEPALGVTLYESTEHPELSQARKILWKTFIEQILEHGLAGEVQV